MKKYISQHPTELRNAQVADLSKIKPSDLFDLSSLNNKGIERNRIIEKNSLVVIGIPTHLCDAEILSGHEYLGQYGQTEKSL